MKSIKLTSTKNKLQNETLIDDENHQILSIKTMLKTSMFSNHRNDIDFRFIDDLIYYLLEYDNELIKSRLCISFNAIHDVFKLIHDNCFHVEHYRVYAKLIEFVYIHKLFKQLIIYIRHCFFCQLNQTKRHRFYEKLISLFTLFMFFHILIID